MKNETILILCAHNDDQILGCGGTFAKYAKEGKKVKTIIFSYGENSHPHFKPGIIKKTRKKEAEESDKILGGSGIKFLSLADAQFKRELKEKNIKEVIAKIIKKEKPSKIFTHNNGEMHPDHNAVHSLVKELINERIINCDVYLFEIWTVLKVKKNLPTMIVDISQTYKTKVNAMKAHRSQYNLPGVIGLRWKMYFNAILNGWNNKYKYAEVFYKLK